MKLKICHPGREGSCGRLEPECSESEEGAVESKLEEVKSELQAAIEKRRQDRRTFEKFNYEVGWFEGLENVSFNDPCLQKLLEEFREDIAPLLEEIGDILPPGMISSTAPLSNPLKCPLISAPKLRHFR